MPGEFQSLAGRLMSLIRDVALRRAIPDDAKSMAFVHRTTWRTAYAKFIDKSTIRAFSAEDSEERFRGFLQDERCRSFVAIAPIDGKIVGYS